VGDVLSDSAAQPAASPPGDAGTPAQGKLEAILAQDPNALARIPGEVTLRDDGSAASGDDVAGDGVYSALIPADFEGHYNFVFLVDGVSASGGRFVRQQIRTAHVRSMPDNGATQHTSNVVATSSGPVLVATITPRNVRNGKVGPGWANYFWFTPAGGAPVKPVDNLNGTYTANIPFTGSSPPVVPVVFLPQPVVRPAGFVPTPGDVATGITVVDNAAQPQGPAARAVWFGLGATFPAGSFGNNHDGDFAGTLEIEFPIGPSLSLEATLGVHQFSGQGGLPDLDVTQFGVNGKWYLAPSGFKPFLTLGVGGYAFDPGSTRFGANAGVGLQLDVAPRWSIEGRYTYHWISGNAPNSRYSTLLLGARYEF
jgi:hypothetical protein